MPYIDKTCDKCGKSGKEVYERYPSTYDMSTKIKVEFVGNNLWRLVHQETQYWCLRCLKNDHEGYYVLNRKVEIIEDKDNGT